MGDLRGAVEAADKFVSYYGTRDPYRLAKYLGVTIQHYDLGASILGYSTHVRRIPIITLNSNNTEHQDKAVCSHELGHCKLHTDCDTNFFNRAAPLMVTGIEAEANAFAFELMFGGKQISPMNYDAILADSGLPSWMYIFFEDIHRSSLEPDEY